MEDVRIDRSAMRKVLRSQGVERALMKAARPIAGRLEQVTPRRTGATAASTRIEGGHTNAKRDRVAVRIYQSEAAVPQEFGRGRRAQHRRYALRAF